MGTTNRLFIAAVLFVTLSGLSLAQEGEDLSAFLKDDAPALLFGVYDVSLTTWQGGIGVMLSPMENFHWRFSFSPRVESYESTPSDTSNLDVSNDNTILRVTAAPFWVLSQSGRTAFTAGPSLAYSYGILNQWWEGNWRRPEAEATRTTHSITIGANFGVLYALTDAIVLHAEYVLQGAYSMEQNEYSNELQNADVNTWNLSTYAAFSMAIRL